MFPYEVTYYYGEGSNDYQTAYLYTEEEAEDVLSRLGYHYSSTYGTERVYYNDADLIASILPREA